MKPIRYFNEVYLNFMNFHYICLIIYIDSRKVYVKERQGNCTKVSFGSEIIKFNFLH